MKRRRWIYLIMGLALAGALMVGLLLSFVHVIPDRAMTRSAMTETMVRMEIYLRQAGTFPADLAVLPKREGYTNRTTDGWDRPLIYTVESSDSFTLQSLGRDGKPGGTGDDIIRRYRVTNGQVDEVRDSE